MTNKEIIKAISQKTQIPIPVKKDCEQFTKGRLIGHLSYWISLAKLQYGKHSSKFDKFWEKQDENYHREILTLFEIDIDSYQFENPDNKLDLG
ncbi:MAG: hypothetical protein AAGE84_24955 [Cyanobacteria bacterium P01_G01_bin.39]